MTIMHHGMPYSIAYFTQWSSMIWNNNRSKTSTNSSFVPSPTCHAVLNWCQNQVSGMKCRMIQSHVDSGIHDSSQLYISYTFHQLGAENMVQPMFKILVIPNFTAATYSRNQNGISCNYLPQENVVFLQKKPWLMARVWGKLCGFIHYNVQYVVFIVAYVTLRQQFDIRWWQMF